MDTKTHKPTIPPLSCCSSQTSRSSMSEPLMCCSDTDPGSGPCIFPNLGYRWESGAALAVFPGPWPSSTWTLLLSRELCRASLLASSHSQSLLLPRTYNSSCMLRRLLSGEKTHLFAPAPFPHGSLSIILLLLLFLFTAAPAAYGSSQARGQMGDVAPAYTTATATLDPSSICDLQRQLTATPDP